LSTTLATLARGRDNNLNLLRIVAASLVLVSHSFVLVSGNPQAEPWNAVLGRSPGGLAVDVFFLVSGFLVTGSAMKQAAVWPYVRARAMRIYPGLWMALLFTLALVGAGFSSLPAAAFFSEPQTWKYLAKNALMITGAEAALPGAFAGNPFTGVVNGSLWTLRYELRLYALLALGWWALGRWARAQAPQRLRQGVTALALLLSLAAVAQLWAPAQSDAVRLGGMFFSGAAMWTWRERLQLRGRWVALGVAAMAVAALVSPRVFEPVYRAALPGLVFWLAYRPAGWPRAYNRVGDYSYGVYIYAFPVQQALVAAWPGLGVAGLTASAGALTLALAVLSWHAVEQPALRWGRRFQPRAAG
jgi:peptidoglycan/LPS O-acetylase OafA/YrhL